MSKLCVNMVATKGNLFYLDVNHLNLKFWLNSQNFHAILKCYHDYNKEYINSHLDRWKMVNKYTYRVW